MEAGGAAGRKVEERGNQRFPRDSAHSTISQTAALTARELAVNLFVFLLRLEHVSAESQRRVWERHQNQDARLRAQRRQIRRSKVLRGGES